MAAQSTIGEGDSMLAGIVLGLSRGLALNQAVRFGMAAGAAALLGSGTALCRLADVERLYAQMSPIQSVCGSLWVEPSETGVLGAAEQVTGQAFAVASNFAH